MSVSAQVLILFAIALTGILCRKNQIGIMEPEVICTPFVSEFIVRNTSCMSDHTADECCNDNCSMGGTFCIERRQCFFSELPELFR